MSQVRLPEAHSMNKGVNMGVIDPRTGGQQGLLPDYKNYANASKMTKGRFFSVLMEAPAGMALMPDGTDRIAFLKNLIEVFPKSISGFTDNRAVATNEAIINNGSEIVQDPSRVTRDRSVPNFGYDEIPGKLIHSFYTDWIDYLLGYYDGPAPLIVTRDEYATAGRPAFDSSFRGAIILSIEANPEFTAPVAAYLTANVFPLGTTYESGFEAGGENSTPEITIEMAGWTAPQEAALILAKTYMDTIKKAGLAPPSMPSFTTGQSAELADDAVASGARKAVNDVAASL